MGIDNEGEDILRAMTAVPEEDLIAWINRIKQEKPDLV